MKYLMRFLLCLLCLSALCTSALAASDTVVGTLNTAPRSMLEETPFQTQCQLGSVAADAVRTAAGAQVALVNTGDLDKDLNDGEVTEEEVERVFTEDRTLAIAEVSSAELFRILEHSVSQITVDSTNEKVLTEQSEFDGFCQISGFAFQYDVSAPVGERVTQVILDDGTELRADDDGTTVTLAATGYMLAGGYGYDVVNAEETDSTLVRALSAAVAANTELAPEKNDRIMMIGARQNTIAGQLNRPMILAAAGLLILFSLFWGMKGKKKDMFREEREESQRYGLFYSR